MRLNSPQINLITRACMKASRSLIRDFGEIENLQVSTKGPGDFVTSADKRTEKIIIDELQKAHPDYGIVTEETGIINKSNNKNRWIIDPIDGTMNFLNGIPQFAISIGYEEENEIKCGVIFNPIMNEMYCAEKGNGAYLNNSRIRVSNKKKIKDALLVTGGPRQASKIKDKIFSEYINISKHVSNVRKFGSAALDIAYVACGRFDGYWQRELNYWDIAAGIIILKEAGGFIDFFEMDNKIQIYSLKEFIQNNFLKRKDMDIKFLENAHDEGFFNTASEIVHFGWKKEAIPVTHFKKSIIARFFDAIFG